MKLNQYLTVRVAGSIGYSGCLGLKCPAVAWHWLCDDEHGLATCHANKRLGISDQFTLAMTSSVVIGLCLAFPYAFWELWRFIKPGLRQQERRAAQGAVFFVSTLFVSGLLFGYYTVSPLSINFLANFQLAPGLKNQFDINSYLSVIIALSLGCALIFQLPVVVFMLSKAGGVTPAFMRIYRRHAWIIILVIAGVITPSPEIILHPTSHQLDEPRPRRLPITALVCLLWMCVYDHWWVCAHLRHGIHRSWETI